MYGSERATGRTGPILYELSKANAITCRFREGSTNALCEAKECRSIPLFINIESSSSRKELSLGCPIDKQFVQKV